MNNQQFVPITTAENLLLTHKILAETYLNFDGEEDEMLKLGFDATVAQLGEIKGMACWTRCTLLMTLVEKDPRIGLYVHYNNDQTKVHFETVLYAVAAKHPLE